MNTKTFTQLIQKNHLTVKGLSIFLQVSESIIKDWITGKQPLPKAASSSFQTLCWQFDEIININHELTKRAATNPTAALQYIPLLQYTNDDDFFHYCDDAPLFKSFLILCSVINRSAEVLKDSGFTPIKVDFDAQRYNAWLTESRKSNSSASRAHWAAVQAAKGHKHPHLHVQKLR